MAYTYPYSASAAAAPHQATLHMAAGAAAAGAGPTPPLSSFQTTSGGPQHTSSNSNSFSDQHTSVSSSSLATKQQQRVIANVGSRSTSLPLHLQMGLGQSKPTPPTPTPTHPTPTSAGSSSSTSHPPLSASAKGLTAAVTGGINLKRAFARRRKNSEDVSKLFSSKSQERQDEKLRGGGVSAPSLATNHQALRSPPPLAVVQHSTPPRMETTKSPMSPILKQPIVVSPVPHLPSPPPPTPPKKEAPSTPTMAVQIEPAPLPATLNRSSVVPVSPGVLSYISMMDQSQPTDTERENIGAAADKHEVKENWRKSDSTNSHHTIRPPPGGASRSSRPVSWAESFQSAHTVVQSTNKRLSALVGDADFGMPEEDDEDGSSTSSHQDKVKGASPNASTRSLNRRSMSLNLGRTTATAVPPPAPVSADMKHPSHSFSEGFPPMHPTVPLVPLRAPVLAPSASQPQPASTTIPANLRGKLAAWGTASGNPYMTPPPGASSTQYTRNNLPPPPSAPQQSTASSHPSHHPQSHPHQNAYQNPQTQHHSNHNPQPSTSPSSFRQTAISMSANMGPVAAGIARRAVDKIGRKWAQVAAPSSSSSNSGSLSSASASAASSVLEPQSGSSATGSAGGMNMGEVLVRTASNLSMTGTSKSFLMYTHHGRSGHKRGTTTSNANHNNANANGTGTGAGSISSSSMASADSDFFAQPSGPSLGEQLRGSMRSASGAKAIAGVVFGRNLGAVVRDTGVGVGAGKGLQGLQSEKARGKRREGLVGLIEERMIPAVAVRCAQHLLLWGVQEEGLFRLNGRPAHVSKLRSEFDSGADYDMTECSPGDLDPHAVASVFKAYLRELPEPILTQKLQPLFDAAINKETSSNAVDHTGPSRLNGRGMQGLPSGPKSGFTSGLRKPPSLSTLAMPTFTGIPPASKALVSAIRALIKRLPRENRDLLLTVVDLIKATARNSKETKMPLSNLLVVFCPSLNMTPPLLKVLCEAEGIWSESDEEVEEEGGDIPAVIDIRRQTIKEAPAPLPVEKDDASSTTSSRRMDDESDGMASSRPSLDNPGSEYNGSAEGSIYEGRVAVPRPRVRRADFDRDREEIPTVYMDTRSHLSSTSSVSSLLQQEPGAGAATAYDIPFARRTTQDRCDTGSISSGGAYSIQHATSLSASSPPPLSSSAESIATPTSSGNPSFADLSLDKPASKDQEMHHAIDLQHRHLDRNGSEPLIVEHMPMELQRPQGNKRPFISNPIPITTSVQFPITALVVPSPTTKRRSIPLLSLPTFTPTTSPTMESSAQVSPRSAGVGSESRTLRAKKPSLKLLFNKRSTSSLNSFKDRNSNGISYISAPIMEGQTSHQVSPKSGSDSSSSVSTPISAVTAPLASGSANASCMQFPPVLDTPIEDPSFSMDLGFDVSPPPTATLSDKQSESARSTTYSPASPLPAVEKGKGSAYVSNSPYGSRYAHAQSDTEPVKYGGSRRMVMGRANQNQYHHQIRPQASSSNLSIVSTASSHHLSLFEDDDEEQVEDWTKSVLLAADVDENWAIQKPDPRS